MASSGSAPNLLQLAEEGYPHHLLHALRETDFPQSHLDEAAHLAAWHGHAQCLSLLLAAGADLDSLNSHGEPLLLEAVHSQNVETVQVLLEAGYDVNSHVGNTQETGTVVPLHYAIITSQADTMVELLLKAGASTEDRNSDTDTPVIAAANVGTTSVVTSLILAGCDLDAEGYEGNTALHRAIECGHQPIVRLLLESGASPNIENIQGNTALMTACETGNTSAVHLLIEHGMITDYGHVNKELKNSFHCAAACGDGDLVEMLKSQGVAADERDMFTNTPLITAAYLTHEGFAVKLLEKATTLDLNAQGEDGRTALHWGACHGLLQLVTSLLQMPNVDTQMRDDSKDTPVLLAAKSRQFDAVRLLMPSDKDMNTQGDRGMTLLHWSVVHGEQSIVKELLESQVVDLEMRDVAGNTALLLAASLHRYIEMRMLLRHGSEVNVQGASNRTALHWVCKRGYADMVRQLLERHSLLDVVDNEMNTPLLVAVKHGKEEVAIDLVKAGAQLNLVDTDGRNVLHHIASLGLKQVVDEVLSRGAQADVADKKGNTPLVLAAEKGHSELIQALIGHCDVNALGGAGKSTLWYTASQGLQDCVEALLAAGAQPDHGDPSPLIQAARHGHLTTVQSLISAGAGVNMTDQLQRTAVMWAAQGGHLDIVQLLHQAGADLRHEDMSSDTALTIAAWHEHDQLLEYLAPHSDLGHCEHEEGMDALHLAIAKDNLNCVSVLLQAGASINKPDQSTNTALLTAAIHTSGTAILMFLLESGQGFDVDAIGEKGRTMLHWCVGDPDSVALVLHYNPNLNMLDANGASPLLLAIAHEQPSSARLLIDAGCDIHMVHQDERQPIHHAAIYGDADTARLLLQRSVAVDCPTLDGRSPLLLAAIEGHLAVVQVLLEHGCAVNTVYFSAVTALSVAADQRHYEVVKALLEAGAEPDLIGSQKLTPLLSCVFNNDLRGVVTLLQGGASMEPSSGDKHPLQVAAIKGLPAMIVLLLSVTCDVNFVAALLREGAVYVLVEDPSLLSLMQSLSRTPRQLKMLSRRAIRRSLQLPILAAIESMPVPRALQLYLRMADLEAFLE